MKRFKRFMLAIAAVGMLLSTGGVVNASLCSNTNCEDVARNNQSGNANSSQTTSWRRVTLRARNSANSSGNVTARIQNRTTNWLGIHSWHNDGQRTMNNSTTRSPNDLDSTLFTAANRRPFRARLEPAARVTATARVNRHTQ